MAQLDMGNGFSINFDDIPKFVQALQDQLLRLQDLQTKISIQNESSQDGQGGLAALPPANDDYSGTWSSTANPNVQGYVQWSKARQQDLRDLINKVNAAVAGYKQTEQNNTMRP
jgi:hypothetical protein